MVWFILVAAIALSVGMVYVFVDEFDREYEKHMPKQVKVEKYKKF